MFNFAELVLSGFLGALVATIITVLYQHTSEQVKLRRDVLLEINGWLDDFYTRLQAMHVHKERIYEGKDPSLSQEEYRKFNEDIRVLLLSERIKTLVALTYWRR